MRRPAEQSQVVFFVVLVCAPAWHARHPNIRHFWVESFHGDQSLLMTSSFTAAHIDCWPLAVDHCRSPAVCLPICSRIPQNGGTEMAAKTHVFGQYEAAVTPYTPMTRAGECLLFDFRLRHRGVCRPPCDLPRPSHNCPTMGPCATSPHSFSRHPPAAHHSISSRITLGPDHQAP